MVTHFTHSSSATVFLGPLSSVPPRRLASLNSRPVLALGTFCLHPSDLLISHFDILECELISVGSVCSHNHYATYGISCLGIWADFCRFHIHTFIMVSSSVESTVKETLIYGGFKKKKFQLFLLLTSFCVKLCVLIGSCEAIVITII